MASNKPIPKSQKQLSEESTGAMPSVNPKRRELQRSVKEDTVKNLSIGLRDIDEAIFYYFNNVIKPSVIQNGTKINVPFIYGSPERWAAVQKDGFYRDKNGKIQVPVIMVKRDTIVKNRNIGNKLDANNPTQYGIFQKKYSGKNVYDKFSILNNREEVKEFQGVVIPDFVTITYSCMIFTEYVEQMNKLVESINYASDSYWGDTEKFSFRAMIDSYNTVTELTQGQDRSVKTSFSINLLGHIIPDSINAQLQGNRKFFSKAAVKFGLETVNDIGVVERNRYSIARTNSTQSKFYDKAGETLNLTTIEESMTAEQKAYVSLERVYSSNNKTVDVNTEENTLTWYGITIATPPSGFPALTTANFKIFINGMIVENDAIESITQVGSDVIVVFNTGLNFDIASSDEYTISGKFVE